MNRVMLDVKYVICGLIIRAQNLKTVNLLLHILWDGIVFVVITRVRQKPRNKIYKEKLANATVEDNEKINNHITNALISRKNGIIQSEIQQVLSLSNSELQSLIPRLQRIDGVIVQKNYDGSSF